MRNALISAAAAALAAVAAASAQDSGQAEPASPVEQLPAEERHAVPPAEQGRLIEQIDAYLADLDVLTGSFYQIEPTGYVSEGEFWIDRPGRMRFEYADPHPYTLVSDGATYTVWDRELEDVNTRVPLRETPLYMFLKRDVDIAADAEVVAMSETPDELALTIKDRDERVEGTLTLVFARPALELRSFATTDGAGASTEVVLADARRGGDVDPALFLIREPRRRDR